MTAQTIFNRFFKFQFIEYFRNTHRPIVIPRPVRTLVVGISSNSLGFRDCHTSLRTGSQ